MIASCPQCAMSLSFDDDRLPTQPFDVLCPRCRQTVTIMPPPKEEPKLPGSTGMLDTGMLNAAFADQAGQSDPLRTLVDMLMAGMKQSQAKTNEASKWQRRGVLICLDDTAVREQMRAAIDSSRYEIFSADFAPEAIEILHESRADVIVLSPNFALEQQGGAAMMQYINSLTPQVRRRIFVVLVSSQLRTMDTYLAFANNVNLTLRPEDAESFQPIFERSVRDFNELYRPFNQATTTAPF